MTTHDGQCMCGAVRFTVNVSKPEIDCCHCSMCRRWAGGPLLTVPADGPPRFHDEAALGVYRSSDWGERLFCNSCGSAVLWRSVDGAFHAVPAGLLDGVDEIPFTMEIFIDSKPRYYAFEGERKRLTGAEFVAAFSASAND